MAIVNCAYCQHDMPLNLPSVKRIEVASLCKTTDTDLLALVEAVQLTPGLNAPYTAFNALKVLCTKLSCEYCPI